MLGDALNNIVEQPIRPRVHAFRDMSGKPPLFHAHGFSATALRAAIRPVHMHSQLLPPPLYIQPQKEPISPAL
jgi:hypothetical protein